MFGVDGSEGFQERAYPPILHRIGRVARQPTAEDPSAPGRALQQSTRHLQPTPDIPSVVRHRLHQDLHCPAVLPKSKRLLHRNEARALAHMRRTDFSCGKHRQTLKV